MIASKEFGNALRGYRERRKLTLRAFAPICGLPVATIHRAELGYMPSVPTVAALAAATGWPLARCFRLLLPKWSTVGRGGTPEDA